MIIKNITVFAVFSVLLLSSCGKSGASIEFCRTVDRQTLEGSDCNNNQAIGDINIILRNGNSFNFDSIKVQFYKIDGSEQLIDESTSSVNPDWATTALSYSFMETGTYRVVYLTGSGKKIVDAQLTIN